MNRAEVTIARNATGQVCGWRVTHGGLVSAHPIPAHDDAILLATRLVHMATMPTVVRAGESSWRWVCPCGTRSTPHGRLSYVVADARRHAYVTHPAPIRIYT